MRPHPATCLARSHALCGCLAAVTAIAQLSMGISTVEAQERPTFEWVSRDEGLVHPTVTAVYQDRHGFLWIGTRGGLHRYDGYGVQTYVHRVDDSASVGDSYIRDITEGPEGRLWVATFGGGISILDSGTGTFTHVTHHPDDPGSLSNDLVTRFLWDEDGTLWVGTFGGGLNHMDRSTHRVTRFQHDPADPGSLSHDVVKDVLRDRDGTLWVGTDGGGLNRFDPATGTFRHFRHAPDQPGSLAQDNVWDLEVDRDGNLWVATYGGGLDRMLPESGTFVHHAHDSDDPGSISHDNVTSVFQDRRGTLWAGTWLGGLNRLNPDDGTFDHFGFDPFEPRGFQSNRVWSLYEDTFGALWVATTDGLGRFGGTAGRFAWTGASPNDPLGLSDGKVNAMLEGRNGEVWIGTGAGGLNRFADGVEGFRHYRAYPNAPAVFSKEEIYALAEGPRGGIWVGVYTVGVERFDPATERVTHRYIHDPADSTSLLDARVRSVYVDTAGVLWVGTDGGGLSRLDPGARGFVHYRHRSGDPTTLSTNRVGPVLETADGDFWVATYGGGLHRMDRETGEMERFRYDPGDRASLSHDNVVHLFEGAEGSLWASTFGGGLSRLDSVRADGRAAFSRYTTEDGLPSDVTTGLADAGGGRLWVATNDGIARLDPMSGTVDVFDEAAGIFDVSYNVAPVVGRANGDVWFGGDRGITVYTGEPTGAEEAAIAADMVFTGFRKFEQEALLPGPPSAPSEIRLSPDEDVVSFEFAALNYLAADRNAYEYLLAGFNDDWIALGSRRDVAFTNLDPGSYTLRVRGGERLDPDSWKEAQLPLVVVPAVWQTAWFRGLGSLAAALLLWTAYRQRTRAARRRLAQLRHQVQRRESAEQALTRSEDYFRALIEKSQDMLTVVDADGTVRYSGPAVERVLGYSPADRAGGQVTEYAHEGDRDRVIEMIKAAVADPGTLHGFEGRVRHKDGTWRYVESVASAVTIAGEALQVVINTRDVTERVAAEQERAGLEEQLRQSQKLEAVGQLTGGVAHDFNNLLTVILGNLELLADELPPLGAPHELATQARDAADRGARLTQRLLAFSRRQALRPAAVDLRGLVEGMDDLLRRTLGETIKIATLGAEDLWRCEADPTQLEQVILNLAINARDAMPEGGKLTIETGNVRLGDEHADHLADLTPGEYVLLAVSDTGVGMSQDVLEKAFDPFFTTKDVGQGTGLGLSMVYGFVKQSMGHVTIGSEMDEGTSVKIYLPRALGAGDPGVSELGTEEPTGAGEVILVVEDDPGVRVVTVALLRSLGYRTLEAEDASEALRFLEEAATVDLLFTDVVLPGGISGMDLARAAGELRPELGVVFTSGYTRDAIIHHGGLDPAVSLLAKPFTKPGLARTIAQALRSG